MLKAGETNRQRPATGIKAKSGSTATQGDDYKYFCFSFVTFFSFRAFMFDCNMAKCEDEGV